MPAALSLLEVVTSLESGGRPAGGAGGLTSGVPSLGGEHVGADGRPRLKNMKFVPEDYFADMRSGSIAIGDILVVKDGATTGKTALVDADFPFPLAAANEHVFVVRCDPQKADSHFVYHWLRSPEGNAQVMSDFRGSAQGGITRAFARAVRLPALPLEEQRRIARLLDEAERLRRLRKEANERARRMVPALFVEMFGDPETNPMGWDTTVLGDALEGIETGWSPVCLDRPARGDEWGVLKLGAVSWNWFDESVNKALPPTVVPREHLAVAVGDVLMSRKNTRELVGASVLVDRTSPRRMYPDLMFRLRPNDRVDPWYLWGVLQTSMVREQIRERASGSAASMCNVSQGRLREVTVMLPPRRTQDAFGGLASALARSRRIQERATDSLLNFDEALRSRLFAEAL